MIGDNEGVGYPAPLINLEKAFCQGECERDTIDGIVDREPEDSTAILVEEVAVLAPLFAASTYALSEYDTRYTRLDKVRTRESLAVSRHNAQVSLTDNYREYLVKYGVDSVDKLLLVEDLAVLDALKILTRERIHLYDGQEGMVTTGLRARETGNFDKFLQIGFELTFATELYCRLTLAGSLLEDRDATLCYIFDNPGIDKLPPELLQVIYNDSQLNGSSVLRKALRDQNSHALSPEQYMRVGRISPNAEIALGGMAAGMCVAGGVKCPLTQFGLCERFVDTSTAEMYTSHVTSDIEDVTRDNLKQRLAALDSLKTAGKIITSKWFQFSGDVRSINSKPVQKNGRGVSGNPNKRSQQTSPELNEPRIFIEAPPIMLKEPQDLPFIVNGMDDEVIDPADETGVTVTINKIIRSKIVEDYLNNHRQVRPSLEELLRNMVRQACLPRLHKNEGGAIPLSTVRPRVMDGLTYRAWRSSGKAIRHSAGKIGEDTRMYYWVATDNEGNRVVKISRVCTKADAVKPMAHNKVAV